MVVLSFTIFVNGTIREMHLIELRVLLVNSIYGRITVKCLLLRL